MPWNCFKRAILSQLQTRHRRAGFLVSQTHKHANACNHNIEIFQHFANYWTILFSFVECSTYSANLNILQWNVFLWKVGYVSVLLCECERVCVSIALYLSVDIELFRELQIQSRHSMHEFQIETTASLPHFISVDMRELCSMMSFLGNRNYLTTKYLTAIIKIHENFVG